MSKNPLGEDASYTASAEKVYAPELLFAIPRSENREKLAVKESLPFFGWDRWNAYEFSYLDINGKPQVGCLSLDIPCESLYIVESKSLKLYFNSFTFKRFNNQDALLNIISKDLSDLLQCDIKLKLHSLSELAYQGFNQTLDLGVCLDDILLEGDISFDAVDSSVLNLEKGSIAETLSTQLFRSLCPVTSQPDWASIIISYEGKKINHESLLRYLLSFRKHQGFHEDCAERIFCDLTKACAPEKLSIYAAFTRRGGIDINPFRTNYQKQIPFKRLARQ